MPTFFSTDVLTLLMQMLGAVGSYSTKPDLEARPRMGLEEQESLWGVGGGDTACAVLGPGSV